MTMGNGGDLMRMKLSLGQLCAVLGTVIFATVVVARGYQQISDDLLALRKDIAAINQSIADRSTQIGALTDKTGQLSAGVDDLTKRAGGVEGRLTAAEQKLVNLGTAVGRLECAIRPRGVDCTRTQP